MKLTRLKTLKMPTFRIFNVLLLFHSTLIATQIREYDSAEVIKNPTRLSAFLRNLSQPISNRELPAPDEFEVTTWRPNKSVRSVPDPDKTNTTTNSTINSVDTPSNKIRYLITPRKDKPLPEISSMRGIDKDNIRRPEEIIRSALINHTLDHGGEEDLDKLVFSSLPQGSKLVLRTVRIIRTDENGDPVDEEEKAQPTYWDVTLANATDKIADDEEEPVTEEESDDEDEDEKTTTTVDPPTARQIFLSGGRRRRVNGRGRRGRKKPDLISAGSHSAENYHLHNSYGTVGREKELGKTNYNHNTHGDTHKQTYTVTDGKDIKPYRGVEKGVTDYDNSHGGHNNDHGERFKSSKRKNKGRKVTGFKREYHKTEFQRTEHFYDDEEARKIAESFGLTEAKEASDHGTKGDKRKYHGVRTDYLDGKQHKNEHGTHDGHDKGQYNTYKDSEKHSHHNNYGKSMSHYDGSSPQNHHDGNHYHNQNVGGGGGEGYHESNHQQPTYSPPDHRRNEEDAHQTNHQPSYPDIEYHPNHNYETSHSTPKKKKKIPRLPTSINDKLGGTSHAVAVVADGGGRTQGLSSHQYSNNPAIISAPIATSFSVTEFSPIAPPGGKTVTSPDPTVLSIIEDAVRKYPAKGFTYDPIANFTSDYPDYNATSSDYEDHGEYDSYDNDDGSKTRKKPQERKIFFSPKHREVKEDPKAHKETNYVFTNNYHQPVPVSALSYQLQPYPTGASFNLGNHHIVKAHGVAAENYAAKNNENNLYGAPNFSSPGKLPPYATTRPETSAQDTHHGHPHNHHHQTHRHPKVWRWPRRRRPRPHVIPHNRHSSLETSNYPINPNHVHLAAIPLRHAHAYSRLGNRFRYRNLQSSEPFTSSSQIEMSTRKSDDGGISIEDIFPNIENTTENSDLDPYFNHNHRYAKNHLTSTTDPLNSPNDGTVSYTKGGVRNTLFGNSPGVYSTIVKVLPAKMMKMNGTQLVPGSSNNVVTATATESDSSNAQVTKRPKTATEMISITTAYPSHLHYQMHNSNPHYRPFIPGNIWPNFNLINRQKIYPTQFGPSHHPFANTGGIMRGILKPFTRGSYLRHHHHNMPPPQSLIQSTLSSPTAATQMQVPLQAPVHYSGTSLSQYLPSLRRFPTYRQLNTHYPVSYNRPPPSMILSLGSKDYISAVTPPPTFLSSTATPEKKAKFYYSLNATNISEHKIGRLSVGNESDSEVISGRKKLRYKPTLKVAPTISHSSTASSSIPLEYTTIVVKRPSSSSTSSDLLERQDSTTTQSLSSTTSPSFINGLMDSVSGFFEKIG